MNRIRKNRFCLWLIWFIPIGLTGFFSVLVWTMWNLCMYYIESEKYKLRQKPLKDWPQYKELNKPENLTEEDEKILRYAPNAVKVGEGFWIYNINEM